MRRSRIRLAIGAWTLGLGLLAGGVAAGLRGSAAGRDEAPSGLGAVTAATVGDRPVSAEPEPAQPVSGVAAVRDTLWISVRAAGRAVAVRRVALVAQVAGLVEAVLVRDNDVVAPGDALLRIDSTEYALAVARADGELRRARADYERIVLFDDRIPEAGVRAGRAAIARSRSGLDQGEAALAQARLQLERSRVYAPFAGRVADVRVVPGEHVPAGAELLTVVDLDPIAVEASVLEAELGALVEGRRASVRFAALPGAPFTGRIETVNPVVDPERGTGRVTIRLPNPSGRIKPGMYAEVSLAATPLPDRLLVPRAAILERGEGRRRSMLFVYEERDGRGRARWRYVTTGRENERLVEIVPSAEGTVEPGEIVLVDGHHYLAHDAPVRLVDGAAAEGGAVER